MGGPPCVAMDCLDIGVHCTGTGWLPKREESFGRILPRKLRRYMRLKWTLELVGVCGICIFLLCFVLYPT